MLPGMARFRRQLNIACCKVGLVSLTISLAEELLSLGLSKVISLLDMPSDTIRLHCSSKRKWWNIF